MVAKAKLTAIPEHSSLLDSSPIALVVVLNENTSVCMNGTPVPKLTPRLARAVLRSHIRQIWKLIMGMC